MGLGVWCQKKAYTFSVLSHFYIGEGQLCPGANAGPRFTGVCG